MLYFTLQRYSFRLSVYIEIFFHRLIYMSLLLRETHCRDLRSCSSFVCYLQHDYEENKSPTLRDSIIALVSGDQRNCGSRGDLWYPIERIYQDHNDTTGPGLVNNIKLQQIWLSQKSIANLKQGNVI